MCDLLKTPSASSPSLAIFQAGGGRLGARMTVYSVLQVLSWKYDLVVVVEKKTMEMMTSYFTMQVSNIITILCNTII